MTQPDIIQTILKDSNYHLDLFDESEIQSLRKKFSLKQSKAKRPHLSVVPSAESPIQLKPEELIRQLYAARLLNPYRYSKERVRFEHLVNFGRERKRADIVILDKDRTDTPYIIIEVKKPNSKTVKTNSVPTATPTGAPIAVWTNGQQFLITIARIRITLKKSPISLTRIKPLLTYSTSVLRLKTSSSRINSQRSANP